MTAKPDVAARAAVAGARRFLKLRKRALVAAAGRGSGSLGPTAAAASAVMGATLGRIPGLIDQLLEAGPVVVVVEAPDNDWAAALGGAVRECVRSDACLPALVDVDGSRSAEPDREAGPRRPSAAPVRVFTGASRVSDRESKDATKSIGDMCSVVAIAGAPGQELPPAVLRAADHRIVACRLDADLLALVVAAVAGSRPTQRLPTELFPLLDLDDIRLALHRDRGPDGCVERLENLLRPRIRATSGRPRLEDLRGYGFAGEWGMALAEDLRAFARSEIPAADLPKGAVFWGPSGVGKTYLAAAIAAQAGVPLLVGSLGQWQSVGEAHLGTTLKAMRQFFASARAQAPAVAFIDELDSFGDRAKFSDHHKDYSTQIVNSLLECLDGFEHRDGVVLLGATNLPNRIDPAITRSGRFDRMIEITHPSRSDLEAIVRFHLGTDLRDADLEEVARRITGGTGADCAALVRRARSRARRHGRPLALQDMLAETDVAAEQPSLEVRRRMAIHESGHATVAHALRMPVGDIGIGSAFESARGFAFVEVPDIVTRGTCRAFLSVAMAGRAAEIVLLGEPSAGAASDLAGATEIATKMHGAWGLGPWLAVLDPSWSSARLHALVETEIRHALKRATAIVEERRRPLERLAETLIERRSLTGAEALAILDSALASILPTAPSVSMEIDHD